MVSESGQFMGVQTVPATPLADNSTQNKCTITARKVKFMGFNLARYQKRWL